MIDPPQTPVAGSSENAQEFRRVFVTRVHQLLELGYRRLAAAALVDEEEPAITGELVKAMRAVLDDPASEGWVDRFSVHDDPPVNDSKRRGKRRRRVDIRVESAQRRPRSQFAIEAKRLSTKCPLGDYLGSQGLGCFLSGSYAADEEDAGMLGYVQSDTTQAWASKAAAVLMKKAKAFGLDTKANWTPSVVTSGPACSYRTRHTRKTTGREIDIYHTFLSFQ